jgi:hypothetical protein
VASRRLAAQQLFAPLVPGSISVQGNLRTTLHFLFFQYLYLIIRTINHVMLGPL